ncbi:unnamed protein product [Paramecium sonneborni]|uniref:Uncharacterized protein n=1 Tax=Paramecium sonneborni TaxID=65129 RepID=A0A8S1QRG8_9CILI|nr:unnamed protein product [Paramecium sonneborni]
MQETKASKEIDVTDRAKKLISSKFSRIQKSYLIRPKIQIEKLISKILKCNLVQRLLKIKPF